MQKMAAKDAAHEGRILMSRVSFPREENFERSVRHPSGKP